MTLNTHKGTELDWAVDKNSDNDWTINCRDGNNAIVDLTPNTFTLEIFSDWGTAPLKTLTQGDGLTNGGANGALTIALAKAISSIKMSRPEYKYRISYLTAGKPATFLYGKLINSPESVSSPSATSLSATINMGGVNVSATITLGISSASIAAALGVQTANAVYAGPSSGASANPAFRALVIADVPKVIQLACSDETTALTAGTGKITFRMPHAMTVTAVRASLTTAQATGVIFTVNINENGVSILSTKLTIDNTEKTSTTAVTAPVISDTSLADDAEITVDIDQVGDGTAKGLKILLIGS